MSQTNEQKKLLIVEDDLGLQKQLKWCFANYEVIFAHDRATAMTQVQRFQPAVVLQDLGLPPDPAGVTEGLLTLAEIIASAPHTKVIVVTGSHEKSSALQAVAAGAYDFFQKPVDTDVLKLLVERAFQLYSLEMQNRLLRATQPVSLTEQLIATDEAMLKVCRTVEKVAAANVSVLITGESGTGKELIARAVHEHSHYKAGRFVAINCAAIPEHLLESELFGYEKGAFTGAIKQTRGKIELAHNGTLLLDEVGDMPQPLQAKLLRFLQERVIERVGGRSEIPVQVRVVCATNKDLQQLLAAQQFREDLYYRISEVTIHLPPLRERSGGATSIAHAFLRRLNADQALQKKGFTAEAIAALEAYKWPGNVRELESKVKVACVMADGPYITAADLGLSVNTRQSLPLSIKEVRARAERSAIVQALCIADGNISRAADMLDVTRPTLYDMMERYSVSAQVLETKAH